MSLHNRLKHFGNFLDFGEDAEEDSNIKEIRYTELFDVLTNEIQIAVVFEFDSKPFEGLLSIINNVGVIYNQGDTRCNNDNNGLFIDKYSNLRDNCIMDNVDHYTAPLFISENNKFNPLLEFYKGAIFIVHESGKLELLKEGLLVDTIFNFHLSSVDGDFCIYDQSKIIKSDNSYLINFSRKSYPIFDN